MKRLLLTALLAATAQAGPPPARALPPRCFPDPSCDAVTCAALVALAPTVDRLDPGLVYTDPSGDTYVGGDLFYDCPPYQARPRS